METAKLIFVLLVKVSDEVNVFPMIPIVLLGVFSLSEKALINALIESQRNKM